MSVVPLGPGVDMWLFAGFMGVCCVACVHYQGWLGSSIVTLERIIAISATLVGESVERVIVVSVSSPIWVALLSGILPLR